MSLIERKVVLTEKDSEGNTVMNFPVTRAEYVEDAVLSVNGETGAVTISAATQSAQGLMSAADKKKLDGIAEGANNYTYTLPTATASTKGGVTIGNNITVSSGKISLTKSNVTTALGYTPLETAPVTSVNGETGAVTLDFAGSTHTHDYLPLAGGTMTGAIISSSYPSLQSSVTDSQLLLLGGNATNVGAGAKFTLYGGDHTSNSGEFLLQAGKPNGDSAAYSQLIGKPDGTLTWGGNDVITNKYTKSIEINRETGHIFKSDANGRMVIRGGTSVGNDGGSLYLNGTGNSSDAGGFLLQTRSSDGTAINLKGLPNGTLTWNDKDILTTANSNWTISKGTKGWARDNATGFTIQWGLVSSVAGNTNTKVTPPRTFTTAYNITASYGNNTETSYVCDAYVSSNTLYVRTNGQNKKNIYWIAVGLS